MPGVGLVDATGDQHVIRRHFPALRRNWVNVTFTFHINRLHWNWTIFKSNQIKSNLFVINKVHNVTVHKNYISLGWTDRRQLRTYVSHKD